MIGKYAVRFAALGYLAFLLACRSAMSSGGRSATASGRRGTRHDPDALHALKVTLILAGIAVPANTIFGVLAALAIVRYRFRGAGVFNAVVDLPLALSPVVVGLALLPALRSRRLARRSRRRSSRCRHGARDDVRLAAVRRARGRSRPARDRD
jgi:ABC-type sulfate transport system permease subunit